MIKSNTIKPARRRKPKKAYKIPEVLYQLPIPCLLWVPFWLSGIVCARFMPMPLYLAISIFLICIASFIFSKTRVYSLGLISFLCGYFIYINSQNLPENHISNLFVDSDRTINTVYVSENQSWQASLFQQEQNRRQHIQQHVKGRIVSNRQTARSGYRYTLELLSFSDIPVRGRVTLFTEKDYLAYGDVIQSVMRITERRVTNPGEIDFTVLMAQQGIYGSASAVSPIIFIENDVSPFMKFLHTTKNNLREKLKNSLTYSAPMALSLIFGERQYLHEYDDDFYTDTLPLSGLMHFFAVSGLHVGIIALVIIGVLRLLRIPISVARVITILFLIFYAFLCNSTPPVVRAVLFFGFFIMAKMSSRLVSNWQVFLLSLFVVTLVNPLLLFSVSLQFSYLAFMGIIIAVELNKKIMSHEYMDSLKPATKGVVFYFLSYLLIVIFIQFMLIPVTVHYFNVINLNVLIGNFIGLALVGLLLPLFFLILFIPSSFFLFNPLVQSAEYLTDVFNRCIEFLSKMPFVIHHSQRLSELIFMFIFVFIGLLLIVYNTNKRRMWQGVILCTLAFAFLIKIPEEKDFKVIFFNVGNSDAALIRFSADNYMLIDLAAYTNNSRNISRNLLPYLRRENVKSINKVLLTHAHYDHYGGIFKLSERVRIDTLIVTERFYQGEVGQQIKNHENFRETAFFVLSDTLTYRHRDYTIKFLHPDKDFSHRNENNHSIVCRITFQGLNILFTGDIEREAEQHLVRRYQQYLRADILKAAHHGSRTSSSENFMRAVNPELFVISASGNMRRGFPNRRVLDIADRYVNQIFVTGKDSAVTVRGSVGEN